jgi:xanthine dehydrogenase accessory factor
MMASRATGKFVMDKMRSLGFSELELEKVHTPIGIPIGSQTPAEIAISIAAEIVKVLNSD